MRMGKRVVEQGVRSYVFLWWFVPFTFPGLISMLQTIASAHPVGNLRHHRRLQPQRVRAEPRQRAPLQ
jgi:hypothetical protein